MSNINEEYDPDEILRDIGDTEMFEDEARENEAGSEFLDADVLDEFNKEDLGDMGSSLFE